jgi:uncharacterized membrane protein YkvA (DUF1232 family)
VIPDVIPLLGWLDDLGVLSVVAWFVVREVRRHAKRARAQPTLEKHSRITS